VFNPEFFAEGERRIGGKLYAEELFECAVLQWEIIA
jgi:hypothetical protein